MENKIKRMFRSSFGSCQHRNSPDTVEKAIFDLCPINGHDQPPPKPFPSICRNTNKQINDYTIIPRHKISDRYNFPADINTTTTTKVVPPIAPLFPLYKEYFGDKNKKKKKKSKSLYKRRRELGSYVFSTSSSLDSTYFDDWWLTTSDDDTGKEDETETLFSSKSLSSDSSYYRRKTPNHRSSRRNRSNRRRPTTQKCSEVNGFLPRYAPTTTAAGDKMKGSFEVMKSSSDPLKVTAAVTDAVSSSSAGDKMKDRFAVVKSSSDQSRVTTDAVAGDKMKDSFAVVKLLRDQSNVAVAVVAGDKMRDSFAVVKSSKDPYNDFRTSMVEMIMEKQIFGANDLEDLLQCFLSLNSDRHHRIIVEVFTEIWEALFSYWF